MAVRKLRDRWGVDIRLKGSRRIRLRSPENSRTGALAYEARLRSELSAKTPNQVFQGPRLLRDAIEEWYRADVLVNRKPGVKLLYRSYIDRFIMKELGIRNIAEITTLDIEKYKGMLMARGHKLGTINRALIVLSKFYTCALNWGWVSKRPQVDFLQDVPTKFRFLSHEESHALRAAATEFQAGRWHDMVVCALRTGMRISELAALRWEDVDMPHRIINVSRSLSGGIETTPKNGKGRALPIADDLFEALSQRARVGPGVFAMGQSPWNFRQSAMDSFRVLCRRNGFTDVSWHTMRHTFASLLLMAGTPIRTVQYLMGHSSIQMTMRYAHLSPGALEDAMTTLLKAEAHALGSKNGHQMGIIGSGTPAEREASSRFLG